MVNLVELHFSLICELDEDCVDEVGEDICHDMRCLYYNGEDVYEWLYRGYEPFNTVSVLEDRIKDLENELEAYKCANKLLKSTLDEVRNYE